MSQPLPAALCCPPTPVRVLRQQLRIRQTAPQPGDSHDGRQHAAFLLWLSRLLLHLHSGALRCFLTLFMITWSESWFFFWLKRAKRWFCETFCLGIEKVATGLFVHVMQIIGIVLRRTACLDNEQIDASSCKMKRSLLRSWFPGFRCERQLSSS